MSLKWVHDYETMTTCFVGVFIEATTLEKKVFVINRFRNDLDSIYSFLLENKYQEDWHISFNGLEFDMQITEFILNNYENLNSLSSIDIAGEIYQQAQNIINLKKAGVFLPFSIYNCSIKQCDVFKLNHWDNKAKLSSLFNSVL